mgnify:CR=1 FL=1|tara:strand:- start:2213 stop:2599 length:387 start_codon:yes stop_codon:yes gene_type:complete
MTFLLLIAVGAMPPRIIPLHPTTSVIILNQWLLNEASARRAPLLRMIRFSEDAKLADNRGIIAVTNENHTVTAIATLVHPPLTLVDLATTTGDSGTLLMKALVTTTRSIELSDNIDDRWKVAFMFYSS